MKLDSARELKQSLLRTNVVTAAVATRARAVSRGAAATANLEAVAAQPMTDVPDIVRTIAVGIAPKKGGDYRVALRLQRQSLVGSDVVEQMRSRARGEVDVRYVGRITKRASSKWYRSRLRPLHIGGSVAHYKVTAGTIGAFVKNTSGEPFLLSNNHVLANEDNAKVRDEILQPGPLDGGKLTKDAIGRLRRWVKMKRWDNIVDAALAEIYDDVDFYPDYLRDFPQGRRTLRGAAAEDELDIGGRVAKVGRTTGFTQGRITAFELDNVVISYDRGNLSFDDQIEIEGSGAQQFSDGGDSGSLIVNADNFGIALLFAGSDTGGTNGRGLTYANVLGRVLSRLRVKLLV